MAQDLFVYETVTTVFSHLVTLAVFLIGNAITIVQYGNENYPQLTQVVLQVAGLYIAYRFTRRVITSWINMVIFTIKAVLFLIAVVFALVIYLRGAKFMQQDVPYLKSIWDLYNSGTVSNAFGDQLRNTVFNTFLGNLFPQQQPGSFYDSMFLSSQKSDKPKKNKGLKANKEAKTKNKKTRNKRTDKGKNFEKDAADFLSEYGIDVDDEYLDYFNDHFGFDSKGKKQLGKFMDNLNEALGGLGVDLDQIGEFVDRFNV